MATVLQFTDHSECLALSDAVRTDAAKPPGSRLRSLKRRETLWLSEAPFDRIYRLDAGLVSIVGADEAGRELLLRTVSAGEWFGEYCRCPGQHWPHPALEARADQDSQLVEIKYGRWLRELTRNPRAVREFVTRTCIRQAQADRRLLMLARRNADERIGLLLLEHATVRMEARSADAELVTLTHAEIATAAAMTRPHVSVTLARFRRNGLISYDRQGPIGVHITKLREFLAQHDNE
jgi:CRP/FNR family transcriptional regulator